MVLQNNIKGIKFLFKYLNENQNSSEHQNYLVKLCIDLKYDNLILDLYREKILEYQIEIYSEGKTCNSPLDYRVTIREELFVKLKQSKFNINSLSFFHLLKPENFICIWIKYLKMYQIQICNLYERILSHNILKYPENKLTNTSGIYSLNFGLLSKKFRGVLQNK